MREGGGGVDQILNDGNSELGNVCFVVFLRLEKGVDVRWGNESAGKPESSSGGLGPVSAHDGEWNTDMVIPRTIYDIWVSWPSGIGT